MAIAILATLFAVALGLAGILFRSAVRGMLFSTRLVGTDHLSKCRDILLSSPRREVLSSPMSQPSSPPAESVDMAPPNERRAAAAKDDPLLRAVLAAPPLHRELVEEEREALEEYLRWKGLSGAR
jgi:hypothetical protein